MIFGPETVGWAKECGTSMPMKNIMRINVMMADDFIICTFFQGTAVLFPGFAK
jgi:hypothetical protein